MLILDKLLLAPVYGAIWAARQVHNALEQERAAEPARITAELSELYMMLETGSITAEEFDAREKVLLDQLDRLEEPQNQEEAEEKQEEEQEEPQPIATRPPRIAKAPPAPAWSRQGRATKRPDPAFTGKGK
ncbi:MAG: gas vesicle protein GvpG [Actinomycetota bacterium]